MNTVSIPDDIEKGIRPLVEALCATKRIKTMFSCEGHRGRHNCTLNPMPYVYFIADQRIAEAIDTLMVVLTSKEARQGKLNFAWRVTAYFSVPAHNRPLQLIWQLEPCQHHRRKWSRVKMDADLACLIRLVPPLVTLVGESGEIPILATLATQLGVSEDSWLLCDPQ